MWLYPDRKSMSAFFTAHPAMWGHLHNSSNSLTKKTNFYKFMVKKMDIFEVATVTASCVLGMRVGLKRSLWSVDNGQAEAICWSWFVWVCLQCPWDGCDEVKRQQKHSKGDCFIVMIAPRMTKRRHCGHKNRKKTYHRSYICYSELCALCPHYGIWVKYTKGPEQIKLWWDEQKQY